MLLDDAPVKHDQRAEGHGFAPAADLVGGIGGLTEKAIVLLFPVILTVNGDTRRLEVVALENAVDEKLELVERLPAFANQLTWVGSSDPQERRTINH